MAHNEPDDAINSFISYIGNQVGCERVYIFEPNGEKYFQNSYEWCGKGILPQKEYLQNIPREEMSIWLNVFSSGEYVFIEDVDAIAETDPVVYRWIKPQGINSLLAFPLFGGRGILGVDNPAPAFVKQTSSLLEIIVHFVELMIQRRDLYNELNINILQNKQISRLSNGIQYRINLITGELYVDRNKLNEPGYGSFPQDYDELKATIAHHPEFFDHLMTEGIQFEIDHKQNVCAEFLSFSDDRKIRWNRVYITPFLDSEGNVLQLYGVLQDASARHQIIDRYNNYAEARSGGVHICYLSKPAHLYYASNDLISFLGYSRDEFEKHVKSIYTNLIVEEDKEIFRTFVRRMANRSGIGSCEYRMRKKDGSVVRVVDTMESIESSSGIMYGYSFILEKSELEVLLEMANEREKKQLELIRKQYDVLMTLGREYEQVFRIWLDEDRAQLVSSHGSANCRLDNGNTDFMSYSHLCRKYVQNCVYTEDRERLLEAMQPDMVRAAFLSDDEYTVMYRVVSGEEEGIRFVASFKNVDNVIEARKAMKYAYIDALTGVMNRNAFERDFAKAEEYERIGIVFCDINHLKETNDLQGHKHGDELLISLVRLLKEYFSADSIYRIGGDEFICLIGRIDKESFDKRVDMFRNRALQSGNIAAVGHAHGDPRFRNELLQEAEKNMYVMKKEYKHIIEFW